MDTNALRGWIEEHRVCSALTPRLELHEGKRVQVGLDLTLLARHSPATVDAPGCDECYGHYAVLREIAALVLPKGIPEAQCAFSAFDGAHHLRPETRWAPEVQLTIEITHRADTFGGVDDDERRCGAEIEEALRRLGVRPKVWSTAEHFSAGR
jgi:hypothetical protein